MTLLMLVSSFLLTIGGIYYQGWPWLFYGPGLAFSAWVWGHLFGLRLGLNVFIGFLLAWLAFGLDVGVMGGGVWWAFLKGAAVFFIVTVAATQGFLRAVRRGLQ